MATLRSLVLESIRSQAASSIFIFGGPGTGKTLSVRAALSEVTNLIKRRKIDAHLVYVNAGQTRSPYYTMLEIVRQMGINAAPSGWQFARLKFEFERARDAKPTIIAVDEVDSLLYKEREPLIYYLNRQPYVTLVLISNSFSDVANLPARAKSSLQPIPLVFYPYNARQAGEILKERAKHAFKPGTVPADVLQAAAKAAGKLGDIRFGFNLLLLAGLAGEASRRSTVSIKDLNSFLSGLNEIFTTS
jgi:Cdc6-like AAA superfamily ATPase